MSIINTLKFILSHQLTRKNRINALIRFIKWQIGSRLNPYPVVYPFVEDTYLVVERGMTGATGNLYTGLHEFSDMGFLLHFLREDDLFVDVGANIGSYSILASGVCKAKTIAIEPSTVTYNRLMRNVRVNGLESLITTLNIGLGGENTSMFFTKSLDTINHIVTDAESIGEKEKIDIITLDSIIINVNQPLLLKIDVEGFEAQVLKGATHTLSNPNLKAIIIELNGSGLRYSYNEDDIRMQLKEAGFRSFSYNPFSRNLTRKSTNLNHNELYIRDNEFIMDRIINSKKINILNNSF
ncbi:FkbM family methyltransferase [Pontibacter sp. KCTC 32443]|uniref:FkbM family methyltransferase n=1 Tax=Pontibacter TaxID=323449 RepID=UPI00164D9E90|nr:MULTISPECIES: FkbM family methyltransferase [Pontibacter]MBC5773482.1 FkbM family methyltransferase [Pontibacter sp. KCTC 32443]